MYLPLSLSLSLSLYIYIYIHSKISFSYIQWLPIEIIYVMLPGTLGSGWRFMGPGPWILDPGSQILGPEPAISRIYPFLFSEYHVVVQ